MIRIDRMSLCWALALVAGSAASLPASETTVLPPASARFASDDSPEVPSFQKHVSPLLGRLGCNGRACHGSFQGRGDFRLSLFGYDFKADHEALLAADSGRVDIEQVADSLILAKPIDENMHEGGKRMEQGSWQYNVLQAWIAGGAKFDAGEVQTLDSLAVTPVSILFESAEDRAKLQVVAHWADGTSENVTELCRFSSNDDAIAAIDEDGNISSGETGDTHVVVYFDNSVVAIPVLHPVAAPRIAQADASTSPVDRYINDKLDRLGIVAAGSCSDEDFIRRASLDVTGTLPAADQVRSFLKNREPNKRQQFVEQLLETPAYAAWWATRMSDWTGNSEPQLNNALPGRGVASQLWYEWLRQRFAKNEPYDKIVEGIVQAQSRQAGEDYQTYCESMSAACRPGGEKEFAKRDGMPLYWARNNFRKPEERAIGFAYAFLGVRIECAQCHKHPFDQWSKDDFDDFAKLFTPISANPNAVSRDSREQRDQMLASLKIDPKLKGGMLRRAVTDALQSGKTVPFAELVVDDSAALRQARLAAAQAKQNKNKKNKNKNKNRPVQQRAPTGKILGEVDEVELTQDPRIALMRWLREPDNPYFAKAIVNRVWANYFGIGIVNPTDDMNLASPPSHAELLDYLANGLIEHKFDLKWLHREITASDAYQRSTEVNTTNRLDQRNYSRHVPRRLPAEVVQDAVLLASVSDDEARATRQSLSGMAITDALAIQGKNRGQTFGLDVFGRSDRESNCDCDRSDSPSLLQSIYLRNDIDIHRHLGDRQGWVHQVCEQLGIADSRRDPNNPQAAQAKQIKTQISQRIKQYRQAPAQRQQQMRKKFEQQYEKLSTRLQSIGETLPPLDSLLANPEQLTLSDGVVDPVRTHDSSTLAQAIEETYLRTLSRYPETDEIQTTMQFINESKSPAAGFESFVWALLNTKEFIITH